MSTLSRQQSGEIKAIPPEEDVRRAIRSAAGRAVRRLSRERPMEQGGLEEVAREVLSEEALDPGYLGFAMVAVNNAFWGAQFRSTPFERRLILLPHCLRDAAACRGDYSPLGLTCARCGACELGDLSGEAEALGYKVLIAEGTPAVVRLILSGRADAILGVACLDSLEEAFEGLSRLGIPHVAVPLLLDGCTDTVGELDVVREWMHGRGSASGPRTRSYIPMLRAAEGLFEDGVLRSLLDGEAGLDEGGWSGDAAPTDSPIVGAASPQQAHTDGAPGADPLHATESIALDWLLRGGKRFRPFVTLAAYAALTEGPDALRPDSDPSSRIPAGVKRAAVAIETLHKASLVHDDIEDEDSFRYGRATLHRQHGVSTALNVGDYLIGLGYRLVSTLREEFSAECAADILAHLSGSHLKLTRGQGAELLWSGSETGDPTAKQIQAVYTLKTAPAFETALYAGIRLARDSTEGSGSVGCPAAVRRFCRYLGAAYQVKNDLRDWEAKEGDKVVSGQDALAGRPTILRAFAFGTNGQDVRGELNSRAGGAEERLERLREIYEREGAFAKARRLLERYRHAALEEAQKVESASLTELMRFITETVL